MHQCTATVLIPKPCKDNIALFKICDCIPEVWETADVGDTIDISMEILVDKGNGMVTGDNGVYWAQDVNFNRNSLTTWENQETACDLQGLTTKLYQ